MKKKDEIRTLRELSAEELKSKVITAKEELMHLRFKHASGQLEKTSSLEALKRSVARASTVLSEKRE